MLKKFSLNRPLPAGQRGVAALEFALVCTVFLIVFYGVVSYGALFVVQQSLSRAAQEGARAMLQASNAPLQSTPPAEMACAAAMQSAQWLTVFRQNLGLQPLYCAPPTLAPCSYASTLTCATVVVTYLNYRAYPLIPDLIPLGAWMEALMGEGMNWIPVNLNASGTVQLGLHVTNASLYSASYPG